MPGLVSGQTGWDLTITDAATVSDTTLGNDQHFIVTATVRNIGSQNSPGDLPIRVIQSADTTVDDADPRIDFDTIEDPIPPGASFTQSATATETSPGPGTYWIFVCTDPATGETNSNNNCSPPTEVTVTWDDPPQPPQPSQPPQPPQPPQPGGSPGWDLTISNAPIVSDTTLGNDQHFVVTATASNIGTQPSPAHLPIRVIQSADTTVDDADPRIDFDTLEDPIPPGASFTQSATVTETSPGPGTYWIFVCTDTAAGEAKTSNNCSPPTEVTVTWDDPPQPPQPSQPPQPPQPPQPGGSPGWDLTINNAPIVSDTTLGNDQHFVVTATASNIGTQPSPAHLPIRVIQSADTTVDDADPRIDFDTLEDPIPPGASFTQSATVTETSPGPGTYWIFVCTDTAEGEANANNNCSAPTKVTVTWDDPPQPPQPPQPSQPPQPGGSPGWDLTISDALTLSTTILTNDQHFIVTATVRNIGTQPSPSNLPIWAIQSGDTTVDDGDPRIDFDTIEDPIPPGASFTQSATVTETSPGPGTYWIFVCTETATGETDATNNCSSGKMVMVDLAAMPNQILSGSFEE